MHARCKEQLTIAYHGNCRDFWIISHVKNTDSFACFQLTPAGLINTPVMSKKRSLT